MKNIAQVLAAVKSSDAAVAEPASRDLRKLVLSDSGGIQWLGKDILELAMVCKDLRVRWNLIIVLGKLRLSGIQRSASVDWLFERLRDKSSLTRTCALQALMDLSYDDRALRRRVLAVAAEFARTARRRCGHGHASCSR
jgi:hypothetical protein